MPLTTHAPPSCRCLQVLPSLGGFLTGDGDVNLGRVDVLLARLGAVEDEILRRRRLKEERDKGFDAKRKREREDRMAGAAEAAAARAMSASAHHMHFSPDGSAITDAADAAALVAKGALDERIAAFAAHAAADYVAPGLRHTTVAPALSLASTNAGEVASATSSKRVRDVQPAADESIASTTGDYKRTRGEPVGDDSKPRDPPSVPPAPVTAAANKSAAAALRSRLLGLGPAATAAATMAARRIGASPASTTVEEAQPKTESSADVPSQKTDGMTLLPDALAFVVPEATVALGAPVGVVPDVAVATTVAVPAADSAAPDVDLDDIFAAPLAASELADAVAVTAVAPQLANISDLIDTTTPAKSASTARATPSAPADDVEAALDEGLVDEGVAQSIDAVLRTSVLRALMARRTRENVSDAVSGCGGKVYVLTVCFFSPAAFCFSISPSVPPAPRPLHPHARR